MLEISKVIRGTHLNKRILGKAGLTYKSSQNILKLQADMAIYLSGC